MVTVVTLVTDVTIICVVTYVTVLTFISEVSGYHCSYNWLRLGERAGSLSSCRHFLTRLFRYV
jgi:hypothetical protein